MRPIPDAFFPFIEQAERLEQAAYRDPGGVWTIGWGHTGPDVRPGLRILLCQARAWLRQDAGRAFQRLNGVVTPEAVAALSDNQYAALGSLVFNVGADPHWAIWQALDSGHLDDVPAHMMRFNRVDGQVSPGLTRRREAECALWGTP